MGRLSKGSKFCILEAPGYAGKMHHYSLFFLLISVWIQQALPLNVFVSAPHDGLNTQLYILTARQYLNVSNFSLVMQPDCNLVTYNASTPFLAANLSVLTGLKTGAVGPVRAPDDRNCFTTMQPDGNLVVYQILNASYKFPLWASETYAYGYKNSTYRYMILRRDGTVGVYEPDGTELNVAYPFIPVHASSAGPVSNLTYPFPPELEWRPEFPLDGYPYMPAEYFLSQGSYLLTMNGRFTLTLGHDCTLQSQEIWRQNNTVKAEIWDPKPRTVSGNCELRLQQDGRLEIRDNATGVVYWHSGVRREGFVSWVLMLDADVGHVSVRDIMNSTDVLWTSVDPLLRSNPSSVAVWPLVAGVAGGGVFVTLVGLGFWYIHIRPRFLDPSEKAFQRRLQSIGAKSQVLSEAKIRKVTNNFGRRIGHGGFGDVFYGRLADGGEIAAKVLAVGSHQSKEEFYNEIELLSVVHHKYLVSLLGYCSTWKRQILIYEYMGGGDLRHRLQGAGAVRSPLSWQQRKSITLQVAEGLEYLHDKCSPAIIHRDVKSNNILLTANLLVAKVADFGLSKLRKIDHQDSSHVTTVVKGTPGYLDPEYHETGMLTEKSDVYAFGIVLMEILTGQNHLSISQAVSEARRLGQYDDLADPNLRGYFDREEFVSLVELSLCCVRKYNLRRPFMREVVHKLRTIGMTSLESQPRAPVMRFGDDFEHSEEDLTNLTYGARLQCSSIMKDVSDGEDVDSLQNSQPIVES